MIRFLLRLSVILSFPIAVALVTYGFLNHALLAPIKPGDTSTVIFEVPPGKNFSQIASDLRSQELVRYKWSISMLARFSRKDKTIHAGEYELSRSMSPKAILAKLVSGEILKRQITVKEGQTIWEIGPSVQNAGIMSVEEFNKGVADPALLLRAGIAASSFEGYLFPETYQFSRPITAQQVIWTMIEEGEKRWTPEDSEKADQMRLSRHEVLTLASIIEKESGDVAEQPMISSVFHNRLSQGMKLQSDPTVIYGLQNFKGNLTKEDLQNPHSYNTYTNYGLPPGPICNPGDTSVKAALFPSESTYLYFVADGTGKHVFSTTLQEHNEAVARYQKRPAAAVVAAAAAPAAAAAAAVPTAAPDAPEKPAEAPGALP